LTDGIVGRLACTRLRLRARRERPGGH